MTTAIPSHPLANHAAQLGYLRGAALEHEQHHHQQHQQHQHPAHHTPRHHHQPSQQQHPQSHQQQQRQQTAAQLAADRLLAEKNGAKTRIRNVWKHNLEQEFETLRILIEKYSYISMDTEFPGIVARPMGAFTTKADYHYQTMRCNVDLLKMIQLGITLFAEDGSVPPPVLGDGQPYSSNHLPVPCTWQFNFRFSLDDDMYAQESTNLLAKSGIDFQMHEVNGIEPHEFAALLITSGLVLSDDVHWISFHSGYDFGYLMKIMLFQPLPGNEAEFMKLLKIFFPSLYDIKYLMKHASRNQTANDTPLTPQAAQIIANLGQKSGLQDIADELEVKRMGIAHQAGSDSLMTGELFWRMRQLVFNGNINKAYSGQVWGLNGQVAPTFSQQQQQQQTPSQPPSAGLNGAAMYNMPTTPGASQASLMMAPSQHLMSSLTPGGGSNAGTPGANTAGMFGGFQFNKS